MDQTATDLHAAASAALVAHIQAFDALKAADQRNLQQGIVFNENLMAEYNLLVQTERETNQTRREAQRVYQEYRRSHPED